MNKRNVLKCGLIGLGRQVQNDHIPTILKRKDIEIAAGSDPSAESQSIFKKQFPKLTIPFFNNGHELIEKFPNIDFLIIAVPHHQYADLIQLACTKGLYTMKEKPLSMNLEEADKLMKISNFKRKTYICTQRRFNSLYKKAYRLLKELGEIYLFNATYKLNIPNPHEGWRGNKECAGGGCILDMGYHIIDQVNWWFGKPTSLYSQNTACSIPNIDGEVEDTALISFSAKSNVKGTVVISRKAGDKFEEYAVYGQHGNIIGNKKELIFETYKNTKKERFSLSDDSEMLDEQLDFFVKTVKKSGSFEDIIQSNYDNIKFIHNCYKSAEKNSVLHVANK